MKKILGVLMVLFLMNSVNAAFNNEFENSAAHTSPIAGWSGGGTEPCAVVSTTAECDNFPGVRNGSAQCFTTVNTTSNNNNCIETITSDSFFIPSNATQLFYDFYGVSQHNAGGPSPVHNHTIIIKYVNGTEINHRITDKNGSNPGYQQWTSENLSIPSAAQNKQAFIVVQDNFFFDAVGWPGPRRISAFDNFRFEDSTGAQVNITPDNETLNFTATNENNGWVNFTWNSFNGTGFYAYEIYAANSDNNLDIYDDLERILVFETSQGGKGQPHGQQQETVRSFVGSPFYELEGNINYLLVVIDSNDVIIYQYPLSNITQPECYVNEHCDIIESCVLNSCVQGSQQFYADGYILNETDEGVPYATLTFVADYANMDYNKTISTSSVGYYNDSLLLCPNYDIYIRSPGYGTELVSGFDLTKNETHNYTIYHHNLNVLVDDGANGNPLANSTLIVVNKDNESEIYSGVTNESGHGTVLVSEGKEYDIYISKPGYGDCYSNDTILNESVGLIDHRILRYYVMCETNQVFNVTFAVNDHLVHTPINGALVTVKEGFSTVGTLTTNAAGLASILLNGSVQYTVFTTTNLYRPDSRTITPLNDYTEGIDMVKDPAQLEQFTINLRTKEDGVYLATNFRVFCTFIDVNTPTLDMVVSSNASGNYTLVVPDQTECIFQKYVDMNDFQSAKLFYEDLQVTQNETLDLTYNSAGVTPYSIFVGDLLAPAGENRILGSTVYVYYFEGGELILKDWYQDNGLQLAKYFFPNGTNVTITANKTGYTGATDQFIVDYTDSTQDRVRVLGLLPDGGNCILNLFYQSSQLFGDTNDGVIRVGYVIYNDTARSGHIEAGQDFVLDTVLNAGTAFRTINIPCNTPYYAYAEGWGIYDRQGIPYYGLIYKSDLKPIISKDYITNEVLVLKLGGETEFITQPGEGDEVTSPISDQTNIFSRILWSLLRGFGYNLDDDFDFVELILWMAYLTIFIILTGGSYRAIKWAIR